MNSKPEVLFLVVRRIKDSGAWGMLEWLGGEEGIPVAVTLEHTYEGGGKRVKIPDGTWYCTRRVHGVSTGKGYDAWEIHVPGHRYTDIHIANLEEQLDGCLGLGELFTFLNGHPAIGSSGAAFKEFMDLTKDLDDFFIQFRTVGD